ncbi:MAG: heparinase II/III-family protein, partial [Deltaproteobacteria bacterium]|nr:heparinase II/III-family protein [Deltaproteobacteria bacterium]
TQPDGLMLPVDDANPSCLHGAVHYRIFDNKDFLWQWYKPSCGFYSNKLNALSLLLLTDDEPPESPASVPAEASYPDGGLAILRDSFGGSGTFFALVGENGKIRTNGLGHEHPDELSFTLWAYGVPLVIDPGYINWDNHNLVKYSKDHSVILIDGEGSGYDELRNQIGTDAFLGDIESSTMVASLIGRTSYRGSDIRRSVVRVNKNYFLLFDSVKLPDSLTHTVSVQINGAGGGDIEDSSFEIGPNGAVYLREGVSLSIFVLSDGDNLSFSSRREEYARVWGVYGYNDMFIAEAEAKNNIYFLTLLVTSQKKTENVVSSMISKELFYYKWSDESYEYFAVLNNTSGDQQITDSGSVLSVPRGLSVIILSGGKEIERRKIEYSLLNKG